ncbi:tRNA 2-thiocytidine biosynthesis protein TtcA [Prevotella sp. PCHR]|uniref:tRNA 2-thiocytidine biosynthesis protein TtcA n=1 Tax=Xylanibacter caecicola TaxID=2736294 RepID=A0ABX2B2D0_9BACT|nr:tRNA 2-thiocytidine biosynthesis TtcA family protein [Xylanibacter caecicola]NPE25431.1 tRNA 2-thiocytidine biosynthesis protein TtcA [Xylanibacter caecicola]
MAIPTDEQKIERRIVSRFHKGISKYNLIEEGDRILAGISGGKDSLCLLEMLGRRMKIDKPHFTVEAVHIRMENIKYETDTGYLEEFAAQYGIKMHCLTTGFNAHTDTRKSPCFLCSWNRRKQMFMKAQELGCNKIALGHHMDDIIHTAMMNEFFQGHFSTMPAMLKMRKMPLTIIRPLCMVEESDIYRYARYRGYEKQVKLCPYETNSHRSDIRDIFGRIEEMNPEARYSVWNALESEGKLIEV